MMSWATLRNDAGERPVLMLSPLAVSPARQRSGIGGALVRAVTQLADHRREPLVILEGSPVYYPRFGFKDARTHGIALPLPDWAPPDAGQVLLLSTFDPNDPSLHGVIVYHPGA